MKAQGNRKGKAGFLEEIGGAIDVRTAERRGLEHPD